MLAPGLVADIELHAHPESAADQNTRYGTTGASGSLRTQLEARCATRRPSSEGALVWSSRQEELVRSLLVETGHPGRDRRGSNEEPPRGLRLRPDASGTEVGDRESLHRRIVRSAVGGGRDEHFSPNAFADRGLSTYPNPRPPDVDRLRRKPCPDSSKRRRAGHHGLGTAFRSVRFDNSE